MAMKLWIMRHGHAGNESSDPKRERERGLTAEGRATVLAIAKAWGEEDKIPNAIFCSPFQRAVETADIVGKYFGVQVNTDGSLAPIRPMERGILNLIEYDEVKRILIVGHKDNTTPTMNTLGGDVKWNDLVMAEVRRVSMDRDTGEWKLRWSIRPSDIGRKDYTGDE